MAAIIKRKGLANWHVVWWQDGRQHWRSTGTADRNLAERALEEVRELLAGNRREERMRRLLQDAGRQAPPAVNAPVGGLWQEYERQPVRTMAARTRQSKRQWVKAWTEWMARHHPEIRQLQEVTPRLALEFVTALAGRAGQTRNNALSALSSVWKAVRIPLGLEGNPWETVPRAASASIRRKALALDEVRALYAKAVEFGRAGGEAGFWPAAVALGFHTGLRWGDVCTLRWEDIDRERQEIRRLPNKTAKRKRLVVHHLDAEIRQHLPETGGSGPIWPEIARRYRTGDRKLPATLARLFREAKIQTWRPAATGEERTRAVQVAGFHSLRHSYVSLLEDAGLDRATIQTLVGHGSPAMTEHYSHSAAAGRKAAGKMPSLKEPAGSPEPPAPPAAAS